MPLGERARDRRHVRRGWLVRRLLLAADVTGLLAAFFATELLFAGAEKMGDRVAVRRLSAVAGVHGPRVSLVTSCFDARGVLLTMCRVDARRAAAYQHSTTWPGFAGRHRNSTIGH